MRLSAGNENEQRHLLPLVDQLLERGIRPAELWADRGYAAKALDQALREREIEPRISKATPPRRADPRRHTHQRGLARQETTPKNP